MTDRDSKCEKIKDKEKRIKCRWEQLEDVAKEQDRINLRIRKDVMDETDPRWLPIHIADDANAVILAVSRNKGRPRSIMNEQYANDKVRNCQYKYWEMERIENRKKREKK